ncbi:hypothetical protein [Thermogemmata fonticola]|uniref:Uncharacterized protein n=1 Tax=Thermogemmata fonticola TaxID=2755323 RepID=A0A7V8VFG3_9BACT|nr:hypothetical protein [Thermogemmata fonticola]MBA2227011.1 hypothetical protein [Thermogemmata fonticola]
MTPTRPDNTLPSAPPQELLPQTASPHPDGPNAAPSPAAPLTATDKTMSNTTLEPSPTPPIGPDAPASAASAVAASTSPADANLTTPPDLTPSLPPAATASTLPGSADSADSPASPAAPSSADNFRAAFMFTLAFGYLLVVAGLVHRATTPTVTQVELFLIYGCLILLWPVFAVEALLGVWQRDRRQPLRRVVWRLLLVLLFPPFRLGWLDPRFRMIWLPRLGWCCPGKTVFKKLERAFAVPMVLFAFLILPLLLIEYLQAEQIKENVLLALGLDIGIAVIWIAFATEFILKVSVHPRPLSLAKDRWLDVAIVVLPMLEFLLTKWIDAAPLARLVRLGRALSPE